MITKPPTAPSALRVFFRLAVVAALWAPGIRAAPVGEALDTVADTNRADAASQNRIDTLSAEALEMLEAYRQAITETQQLTVYNRELEKIVAEQERRRDALAERVAGVADLRTQLQPLLLRMIDGLDRFVAADLPFKLDERQARIQALRAAMANPQQNLAERFRKVLAAYQAEAEYGRSVDSYRGELLLDGRERLVEFLRVGRVMLLYITPNDRQAGYFDPSAGAWQPLPDRYIGDIREAIRIAKDLAAPQLLRLPVPAPTMATAPGAAPPAGEAPVPAPTEPAGQPEAAS